MGELHVSSNILLSGAIPANGGLPKGQEKVVQLIPVELPHQARKLHRANLPRPGFKSVHVPGDTIINGTACGPSLSGS